MKLLVIEDNAVTSAFVVKGLQREGYVVDHVMSGEEGLSCAKSGTYDLVVCDVMLPDLNGILLVKKLRTTHPGLPVLFLSARDRVEDRVTGLTAGADDYLVKPFSFSELLARIEALLRRSDQSLSQPEELQVADLRLDLVKRKAYRGETEITLQPLEFQLLEYFVRNVGQTLSRAVIMDKIWDSSSEEPSSNMVEVRIHHLRSKVDKPFPTKLIHTVRGVGYILEAR